MRWPRIIFLSLVILLIGAFLHYTLPQRDVVRIVNAESILTELDGWNRIFYASADAGASGRATSRDVRFINTVEENGNTRVYRNEDTSVLWPPYFKFDSQDLQTEAQKPHLERGRPPMGVDHPLRLAAECLLDLSQCGRHHPGLRSGRDVVSLDQYRDPPGDGAGHLHGLADLGTVRGPRHRAFR